MDQEDLLRKVELWKKTSPDDSFAYHPYATYASEEESTRPEEDSDGESDNEGEDERIIKTSTKGFLFVHQSKDQRRLLERLAIWKRNLYARRNLQDHKIQPPSFLCCCQD